MGTADLEVKFLHQVIAIRKEVIHAIFLDLHKVYNTLDSSRCLDILEGYRVGPRALHLLRRYWENLQMVARVGVYYGEPLRGERGVTQGGHYCPPYSM